MSPHYTVGCSTPAPHTRVFCGHVSSCIALDMLHWFPLQQRIAYQCFTLVWRSLLASLRVIFETSGALYLVINIVAYLRSTKHVSFYYPFSHTTNYHNLPS